MNNKTKKTFNDIPLTDLDYEGVIYEPSQKAKKIQKKDKKNKNIENKPKQKIKKAQNFNFNVFIWLTGLMGVIVFGIVGVLTYSTISSYIGIPTPDFTQDNTQNLNTTNNNQNGLVLDSNTDKEFLGVIKDINYEIGLFTFVDVSTNKIYTLKSKPSSVFRDKYSNMLTLQEVKTGVVVEFSFDEDNKINYITETDEGFTIEDVTNTIIDTKLKSLKINDRIFNISDKAVVLKNNEQIDLSDISTLDTLDLKGYDNSIYFIQVKKGNGVLKLENKPDLNNAFIEIDRDIFKSLNEVTTISLSEGKHKVVIRSDDTVSFVQEVDILSGQETVLDLSKIQAKSGTLIIKSQITDYTLYVNGNLETSREPLKLDYGVYVIRAEKEGYNPFETQVSINSPQQTIAINLEKIEKLGKMTISSTPDNAQVFVDNTLVGYTPLTYKLAHGVHTVTLKKEGYNDFVLSSVTIGDEESSFNITMHKKEETTQQTTAITTETTVSQPTM